jgi:hypothetical protein
MSKGNKHTSKDILDNIHSINNDSVIEELVPISSNFIDDYLNLSIDLEDFVSKYLDSLSSRSNTNNKPVPEDLDLDSFYMIYVRTSTVEQWDSNGFSSPDHQLNSCYKYLRDTKIITNPIHHGSFFGEFSSGRSIFSNKNINKRQALLDSLDALARAEFKHKYLVVYNYSRLTRNLDHAKLILDFCKEHDIIICSAFNNSNTSTQEGIDFYLSEVTKAQNWLLDNPEKQKAGMLWNIDHNLHPAGRPSRGLKVENGVLVRDEEEMDVLKHVNALINLNKFTYQQAVDSLNEKNISTESYTYYSPNTPKRWTVGMIKNIVKNSKKNNFVVNFKNKYKTYSKNLLKKQPEKTFIDVVEVVKILSQHYKFKYKIISKDAKIEPDTQLEKELQISYGNFLTSTYKRRKIKRGVSLEVKKTIKSPQEIQIDCAKQLIHSICSYHYIDIQEATPVPKLKKEHNRDTTK